MFETFRYREGFFLICSPLSSPALGTATNIVRKVPNNIGKDGELFVRTCLLYLNRSISRWAALSHKHKKAAALRDNS
jgi:hypothetical protein